MPGTEVLTIERCSGHAGTWGVKAEFHEIALKIGRPVLRQIAELRARLLRLRLPDRRRTTSRKGSTRRCEGQGRSASTRITLLRMAYGLPD